MPVNNQPDPKKNVFFLTPYDINNLCYTRQILNQNLVLSLVLYLDLKLIHKLFHDCFRKYVTLVGRSETVFPQMFKRRALKNFLRLLEKCLNLAPSLSQEKQLLAGLLKLQKGSLRETVYYYKRQLFP